MILGTQLHVLWAIGWDKKLMNVSQIVLELMTGYEFHSFLMYLNLDSQKNCPMLKHHKP